MKQITFNPSNEPYYSDDFIKGFKCGAERQFEADKKARPKGEWIDEHGNRIPMTEHSAYCSHCGEWSEYLTDYCGNCSADMTEREGE